VRVLRVIARMNVGGPAYHVSLLSGRLDPARYETLLVSGRMGRAEGSFDRLAERYGARHLIVDALGPELRPLDDLRAVYRLARIVRGFRPDIVHTHTAKAGLVGRLAARLAAGRRPIVIHTYHGHVLSGYFGPLQTGVYRWLERAMGLVSTRLVAVSRAVADDLVRLRIAPARRFEIVPLGLDLERFLAVTPAAGDPVRAELGLGDDDVLLATAGRLVPIKRLDVLLDAMARAVGEEPRLHLAVVGDGELREELERHAHELGLAAKVSFLGFRDDLDAIQAAADIAVLSSDNEGTPVALIEAAAAGTPAVASRVGGVPDVVAPGCGLLVGAGDPGALAEAILVLARDRERRVELGAAAREHVRGRFSSQRLLADVDRLYRDLLGTTA
jgi:glycosyltransferase involved in cell wall biosynthesis